MSPVYEKLMRCYESVREKVDFQPEIALVLGSGLGDYGKKIQVETILDYHEIEGTTQLFERFIAGDWDEEDFLVLEPGETAVQSYDSAVIKKRLI